jgi:hypothetical protein
MKRHTANATERHQGTLEQQGVDLGRQYGSIGIQAVAAAVSLHEPAEPARTTRVLEERYEEAA